jgi:hypothetical protein
MKILNKVVIFSVILSFIIVFPIKWYCGDFRVIDIFIYSMSFIYIFLELVEIPEEPEYMK